AALFLNNFIAEKTDKKDVTPWCHLDIASVAFDDGKKLATGRNVRLLLEIAERV
ncbi:TPA: leucyl aminopeptidase, partial [Candidatus Peregrinibacteria bacterium]|nr:leucyl aminopeptidase [Candidatus Peregrinibacteria bacterium]